MVAELAGRRGRRPPAAPADGRARPPGRVLSRVRAEAVSRRGRCWRPRASACDGAYRDVDFALHAGEILGIAGVIGSGREAAVPHAVRLRAADRRHASWSTASRCALASPADAVDHGIGYVPRERRTEGLVLFLSVAANITLASLETVAPRRPDRPSRAERRLAQRWVERLRIRTPGIDALCLNLSGGNQQKVVLAKWLNARSRILILDHPTRGLDVGAKEEVYELVRALSDRGHRRDPDRRHAGGDDRPQPHHPGDARRRHHPALRRRARAASPSRSS